MSIDLDDEFNPPLPTPTIPHRDQRRYNFSTSPSRRILPPRTPEIVVRHHDEITPERVKMRMDIAVEFGMEGRPRPLSGSPAQVLGGVEMTRMLFLQCVHVTRGTNFADRTSVDCNSSFPAIIQPQRTNPAKDIPASPSCAFSLIKGNVVLCHASLIE